MTTPKIGKKARGSTTGRPIMVVLDLLGRRTALRILWELRDGPLNFRDLQNACETNSALLNVRLGELKESGIVVHKGDGYELTAAGKKLKTALKPLARWATVWAQATEP
jgi:DNA-binding HxlR family transcriptional regulator